MSHYYGGYYSGFPPHVSVAKRKQKAAKHAAKLQKKGVIYEAHTFFYVVYCVD